MKQIKTEDAVGQILCHDITQIVRGVTKDAKFRKGHVITEEDIPVLLSLGKENIYVWENDETKLHENDAAEILRQITQGEGLEPTPVKEGKIELKAQYDGVFHVAADKLNAINEIDEICIATVNNHIAIRKGKSVAGMRCRICGLRWWTMSGTCGSCFPGMWPVSLRRTVWSWKRSDFPAGTPFSPAIHRSTM